jgi:hypothetical protein
LASETRTEAENVRRSAAFALGAGCKALDYCKPFPPRATTARMFTRPVCKPQFKNGEPASA